MQENQKLAELKNRRDGFKLKEQEENEATRVKNNADSKADNDKKMQDAIETSLAEIDNKYNRISKILEIPIFYDSPEVKSVLRDLQDVKDSLLYVANTLTNSNNLEDDEQQYEQSEKED